MPARVDILMYHSISDGPGPTCIAPAVFEAQMQVLARSGRTVVGMDAVGDWLDGGAIPDGAVAITFDDGFRDFADTAFPVLARHGFRAMVYLPTDRIGGAEDWRGAADPARPLMDWGTVAGLAARGIDFGAHSRTHPDLSALAGAALADEVVGSGQALAARLGRPVHHFAPPYGLGSAEVRALIGAHYRTGVGTRLARATGRADRTDLPRIEMLYFTDPARLRAHLAGRGGVYLAARQALRHVREAVSKPWSRQ